jgi:uncharacterized protein YndB with AHSA1/START domain
MADIAQSRLVVRRSIHIKAPPERVWKEFASFERMDLWWGKTLGTPAAGTPKGQRLLAYEPRTGGHIEMEVIYQGTPLRYGGTIIAFEPNRELTFECDWIPNQGWLRPTLVTIQLTPALDGTLVELFHYAFERTGKNAGDEHAGYEGGWTMTQLNALRDRVTAG